MEGKNPTRTPPEHHPARQDQPWNRAGLLFRPRDERSSGLPRMEKGEQKEGKGEKTLPHLTAPLPDVLQAAGSSWLFPSHQQTPLPFLATGSLLSSGTQNHYSGLWCPHLSFRSPRTPQHPAAKLLPDPGTMMGSSSTKRWTQVPGAAPVPPAHAVR